jgi:sugar lactone lactonase YvrE
MARKFLVMACALGLMVVACDGGTEVSETEATSTASPPTATDPEITTTTTAAAAATTVAEIEGGSLIAVAGNGEKGLAAEGIPASDTELSLPFGLAWNVDGDLYIGQDFRISKVDVATGVITTVAGTGTKGYSGTGGPASEAELGRVQELAFDSEGNLHFADWGSDTIRRIDADGVITTVAGIGTPGFSPDGSLATEAKLLRPFGVAFDSDGTLYFSDGDNHRVRKIESDGTLATVAGTGQLGESGDGGPAIEAQLASPRGLTFDTAGTLYVGTHGGSRIRMIDPNGIIDTVAETAGVNVAVDAAGNLYVATYAGGSVYRVNTEGELEQILVQGSFELGDGMETVMPSYVVLDSEGSIYVSDDRVSFRVYRFEP